MAERDGDNTLTIIKVRDTGRKVGQQQRTVWDVIVDEPFDGNIQTMSDKAADALKALVGKGPQTIKLAFDRDFNGTPQYKMVGCPGYEYNKDGGGGGGKEWSPERIASIQRGNALNAAAMSAPAIGESADLTLLRAEVFFSWLQAGGVGLTPEEVAKAPTPPTRAHNKVSKVSWETFIAHFKDALGTYQELADYDVQTVAFQQMLFQPMCKERGIAYPVTQDHTEAEIALLQSLIPNAMEVLLANHGVSTEPRTEKELV